MRMIVRKERPHPGARLRFTHLDGHRFTCAHPACQRRRLVKLTWGVVGAHFEEVGCDACAEFGAPGPDCSLEAVKVIGVAADDRYLAQAGGHFAVGVISGQDRGQPDQVGPGWVVLEGPGAGVQVEVKDDVGAASLPCPVAQCVDAAWVPRAWISHGTILG
jgi:hypothetical protein